VDLRPQGLELGLGRTELFLMHGLRQHAPQDVDELQPFKCPCVCAPAQIASLSADHHDTKSARATRKQSYGCVRAGVTYLHARQEASQTLQGGTALSTAATSGGPSWAIAGSTRYRCSSTLAGNTCAGRSVL